METRARTSGRSKAPSENAADCHFHLEKENAAESASQKSSARRHRTSAKSKRTTYRASPPQPHDLPAPTQSDLGTPPAL